MKIKPEKKILFETLQYNIKLLCCLLLKILYIFPIKNNRIIFESYSGKSYSCNPKYIYKAISKKYPEEHEAIWVINKKTSDLNHTVCVKRNSLKYCYYMLTSKVIVVNWGVNAFLPYRKNQLVINTWHGGGAYKKMGTDVTLSQIEKKRILQDGKKTDIVISSNRRFSIAFSHAYGLSINKLWEIGMPRNDVLISYNLYDKEKILKRLGFNSKQKLVLYAPTFRGHISKAHSMNTTIDQKKCLDSLKKRFHGEWVFGIRTHYIYNSHKITLSETIDLSNYPDMQELLIAADVLITDYSSCMWDFSLTEKPCFIYATDSDQYINERDFYTPISSWPFPIAKNNEELIDNILNYNKQTYNERVKKHHNQLGICESGHASELVADTIYDYCFNHISKVNITKQNS